MATTKQPKKSTRGKSNKAAHAPAPVVPDGPVLSPKERMRQAAMATAPAASASIPTGFQPRQKPTPGIDLNKKRAISDLDLVEQVFGDDLDGLEEDDN